jgi:hypothetical protein
MLQHNDNERESDRVSASRQQNAEELDNLCNKVCLVCGWCLVLLLFVYIVVIVELRSHQP